MTSRSESRAVRKIIGRLPGGTDGRYYLPISDSVYRFMPFKLDRKVLTMIHGTNEHVSVEGFRQAVRFYHRLIQNAQELGRAER